MGTTVGLYCQGCHCRCHTGRNPAMPEFEKCAHCPRQIKPGAAMAAHVRASHPHAVGTQSPPPSPEPRDQLRWEDPPPERKGRGFAIHAAYAAAVVELKRSPGRWARIRSFKTATGAGGSMARLKRDFPDIEFVGRRVEDGEILSAIWARFVEAD